MDFYLEPDYDDSQIILSAKFIKPESEGIEIHWQSNQESGKIAIENHVEIQGCIIDTFGKSKLFVMNILEKVIENITLNDT